jgi:hypothetical protein
MSITIELTEKAMALLRSAADESGRTMEEVAAERLAESLYEEVDWDAVEGIRRGIAAMEAGDEMPLDEFIELRRRERAAKHLKAPETRKAA